MYPVNPEAKASGFVFRGKCMKQLILMINGGCLRVTARKADTKIPKCRKVVLSAGKSTPANLQRTAIYVLSARIRREEKPRLLGATIERRLLSNHS
jgi:hypothetical protein